jgi:hypothetical protein
MRKKRNEGSKRRQTENDGKTSAAENGADFKQMAMNTYTPSTVFRKVATTYRVLACQCSQLCFAWAELGAPCSTGDDRREPLASTTHPTARKEKEAEGE